MPKIAIIILSLDIINIINLDVLFSSSIGYGNINLVKNLFLISSFLSLLIGTVVGLAQNKIKRLLAYSTISHIGFILLALSVNTEESLESVLFYLIQYSFTNLNIFFIILAFGYILKSGKLNSNNTIPASLALAKGASQPLAVSEATQQGGNGSDISFISELKGQFKDNPILTLSLAVSLFSMAGIPPLLGFFAKAGVLYSSIQNGYYFISLVAIVVSVISAYYYLAIIKVMHFDTVPNSIQSFPASYPATFKVAAGQGASQPLAVSEATQHPRGAVQQGYRRVTNIHSFIIAILTLSILFFILKPSIILNSIHLIALNIFYY
jgi:NADH-ubiquinone oxidoreductase chain 2